MGDPDITYFLPPKRRIVRHLLAMAALSFIVAPILGIWLVIVPAGVADGQALLYAAGVGWFWGLVFALLAAFGYTAWLIVSARRAYQTHLAHWKLQQLQRPGVSGGAHHPAEKND